MAVSSTLVFVGLILGTNIERTRNTSNQSIFGDHLQYADPATIEAIVSIYIGIGGEDDHLPKWLALKATSVAKECHDR